MILGISQAGQIEPLGPLALGVVVESAPLYACPKAGFILTCVRGGGPLSWVLGLAPLL